MATERSTAWSLTINNPGQSDEENINVARQKGWKVEGQLEKGEGGTSHYQLFLRTPQVRFSAVKKAFPRAHIEVARNPTALQQYVHKEETREAELANQSEFYPSLAKFWHLVYDYFNVCEKYGLDKSENEFKLFDGRNINDPDVRLNMLDEATDALIKRGYHVESIAINPSTRSSARRFLTSIFRRCELENYNNANQNLSQETDESHPQGQNPSQDRTEAHA